MDSRIEFDMGIENILKLRQSFDLMAVKLMELKKDVQDPAKPRVPDEILVQLYSGLYEMIINMSFMLGVIISSMEKSRESRAY
jgi:hypothetical protein